MLVITPHKNGNFWLSYAYVTIFWKVLVIDGKLGQKMRPPRGSFARNYGIQYRMLKSTPMSNFNAIFSGSRLIFDGKIVRILILAL
jgi:hypothetical protein